MTKVLCDFDGTTAVNDVGNLLFRTYAGKACFDIVRDWKEGKINSKECLERECAITRVSEEELSAFAATQQLDPAFSEFVRICSKNGIDVEIASDGLDFYIDRILKGHKLESQVAVKANSVVFVGKDRIKPEFPYFDYGCGHCGNCKGYHVRQARLTHDRVVYIGDGMSDRCGAQAADLVFAKRGRDLIRYCVENGISHTPYDDFSEILRETKVLFR